MQAPAHTTAVWSAPAELRHCAAQRARARAWVRVRMCVRVRARSGRLLVVELVAGRRRRRLVERERRLGTNHDNPMT